MFPGLLCAVSSAGPAYAVGTAGDVYAIDLETGSSSILTNIGSKFLTGIAIADSTTAYVLDEGDSYLYSLNLQTGAFSQITPSAVGGSSQFYGMDLADKKTAYLVDYENDIVYSVNLKTGAYSEVVSLFTLSPGIIDIAVASPKTAYVVGYEDGNIYSINLCH